MVPQQGRGQEELTPRSSSGSRRAEAPEPGVWAGWVIFGSVMLILMGAFHMIAGLTALVRSGYYAVPSADLLVSVNYTTWGWVHLGIGALAWAAAFGLTVGSMWARVSAVVLTGLSALVNMAFVAAYPLWSLTMIALNVVVIYAITAHGAELKNTRS
jgi:hypothetical protein